MSRTCRNLVVYLSGKMRGLPDYNRTAFYDFEFVIRSLGFCTVVNPAALPTDLDEKAYMPICIAMLNAVDAVVVLPDYEGSLGVEAEVAYAKCQGKPVVYVGDGYKEELKELYDKIC